MKIKYFIFGKNWVLFTLVLLALLPVACQKDNDPPIETNESGDLIHATSIGTYSAATIQTILNAVSADFNLELKYAVEVVKIVYYTTDPSGNVVQASGALMVPKQVDDLPSICFHHGTETKRSDVASAGPLATGEGFAGMIMASIGFITFEPDYLGLGDSDILHPYLYANSYAEASIDMLTAGVSYCAQNGINSELGSLSGRIF